MKLFVGTNFQLSLLEAFDKLNQKYSPDIVKEVYGSIPNDMLGGVREDSRLSNISWKDIAKFSMLAKLNYIEVCYAINSPAITTEMCSKWIKEFQAGLQRLEDMGITHIIVASPAFAEFVKIYFPAMFIIGSTVMNLDSVNKISALSNLFSRICPSTDRNRDKKFLRKSAEFCEDLEILVNEMCLFRCPWRNYHYVQEALNKYFWSTTKVFQLQNFPINKCWERFVSVPHEILKSRWIRPEDISAYEEFGIEWFKLSGRTLSESWILNTVKAYLSRKYEGNLLDLFPIVAGSLKREKNTVRSIYIDNSRMDGFCEKFFEHDCFSGCIESECNSCKKWWKKLEKDGVVRYGG